jgi:hypothetical protein
LSREYIDDGYSGAELDPPALDQMRKDAKIALYQTIVVGELLKHQRQGLRPQSREQVDA